MCFDLGRQQQRLDTLEARVRCSRAITPELLAQVIVGVCTRLDAHGNIAKRIVNQLAANGACTDAALLLLQLELPQWTLRRIIYEDGEWHCLLSKQPQIPLGLDESTEAAHELLPLAILIAFIKARSTAASVAASVPRISPSPRGVVCCDNFG